MEPFSKRKELTVVSGFAEGYEEIRIIILAQIFTGQKCFFHGVLNAK